MAAVETIEQEVPVSVRDLLTGRRMALGLSQAEVADRAEISLSAYKQYETDRARPPLDKSIRIASVLNFDPRDFFDALDVPSPTQEVSAFRGRGNTSIPVELASQPAFEAVQKVRNLADWKGIHSRHLPDAVVYAHTLLNNLDIDELEDLAELLEVQVEKTSQDDFLKMSNAVRTKRCEELIPRVLGVALYGSDIETMDRNAMEAIHDALSEVTYRGRPLIEARALISERDIDKYLYRLRWQLCSWLLDALALGKPLPSLETDEEADRWMDELEAEEKFLLENTDEDES